MKRTLMILAGLSISISKIQAQGTWYYPGPRGISIIPYTGVFTDPQTGYAVKNPNKFDTADAIQKTIDGGATWTPLSSGPNIPLRSIHFPRYKTGFAIAANGTTLLMTKDAGSNWERWDVDQHLDNIRFLSDSIGYAITDTGGFLKSKDGGKTWKEIPMGGIKIANFYFGTERDGFIIPRDTGIASENPIAKTKNGGATWEWILDAPKIEEMFFLNSQDGYATGSKSVPILSENSLLQIEKGVYKTMDGGVTWKVVLNNRVLAAEPYWEYQRPNMINPELGYVIANKSSHSGPILGSRIMKTVNGGESWTIDFETTEMHLFSLHFPEPNTGYAKGSVVVGNRDQDMAILIKYKYYPVTISPMQKHPLPILGSGKGLFIIGEKMGINALGQRLYSF
jgi:photosystem II stability/assembly factor-like uncharacterized protein